VWLAADLVGVPTGGYPHKDKDAGRACILLPEACGYGWEAVHVS